MCIFAPSNLNYMNVLIAVSREISKLAMFIIIWGFPLYLSRTMEDNRYLWLLVLSFILNIGMFSHYEDLEKIDRANDLKKLKDE